MIIGQDTTRKPRGGLKIQLTSQGMNQGVNRALGHDTTNKSSGERGVGLVEVITVVALISIVSAIAVVNFRKSRNSINLENSVRQLAAYMEKARVDAVRRHGSSNVAFTSNNTYVVRMDFNNSGVLSNRTFNFQSGIQLASSDLPNVTFDWRGRTSSAGTVCVTTFSVKNNSNQGLNVDVSGSGDVTVENQLPSLPNISYTNTNSSAGVNTTTVVSGSSVIDNSPCVDVVGTTEASSGPPNCTITVDKNALYIKKNGGSTGSILLKMSLPSLVGVTKPSNLTLSPTSANVAQSGTTFLVTSNSTLRGPFDITFTAQCGSAITVRVNVTN